MLVFVPDAARDAAIGGEVPGKALALAGREAAVDIDSLEEARVVLEDQKKD